MKNLMTFGPLILIVVVMYLLLIRPQKKREKEVTTMRNNLRVGDEIITIGGICGKIVKTKDESVVIQVGADKLKFEMMRWSISKVVTPSARPVEKEEEAEEEAPKKSLPKRMKKADDEPVEADNGEAPAEEITEAEPATPAEESAEPAKEAEEKKAE